MKMRNAARLLAVPAAAGLITLGLAGPASAHVTVTPEDTAAGSFTVVTMSVPHGCDGSPTTKVAIQIPKDILAVTPTRNPYYDVAKKIEKLARAGDRRPRQRGDRARRQRGVHREDPVARRRARRLRALAAAAGEGRGDAGVPSRPDLREGRDGLDGGPRRRPGRGGAGAPRSRLRDHRGCRGGRGRLPQARSSASASEAEPDDDSDTGTTLGIIGVVLGALGLAAGGTALVLVRRRA